LKSALKNGINSAYGKPLFSGDPDHILDAMSKWNTLTPVQKQGLLALVPPKYIPLFDGTDPDGIIPILNAVSGLSPQAQNAISSFLPGGITGQYAQYQVLFP
jgi:hypothetical protein